jgi:hypothetical protein
LKNQEIKIITYYRRVKMRKILLSVVLVLVICGTCGLVMAGGDEQKAAVMKLQMLVEYGLKAKHPVALYSESEFKDYRDAVINAKIAEPSKDSSVVKSLECYNDALEFWVKFRARKERLGGNNGTVSYLPPTFHKDIFDKYGMEAHISYSKRKGGDIFRGWELRMFLEEVWVKAIL